ncbi:MAG: acyl carrier protein [Chloroflexi bacterium]|nr:MAG: acyl carrier protein [Chloroflexota bacterium]
MVRDAVVEKLVELGLAEEELTDDRLLHADLGLDSTEVVLIEVELKRRFGVQVDLRKEEDCDIGQVCRLVQARLAAAAPVER